MEEVHRLICLSGESNHSIQRTGASRFAQFRFGLSWRLALAADAARWLRPPSV